KPDLVAPGVNVTSLHTNVGYAKGDGTSFAAPYVSGVAALLLAQDPKLNAYDLRFILEETAFHSTELLTQDIPFPDLDAGMYGWGRVDATNAVGYTLNSEAPYDLTVGSGIASAASLHNQNPTLISAWVTNTGGQVVGNVEMKFYFFDVANAQ